MRWDENQTYAKLVLHEVGRVAMELIQQRTDLVIGKVLEATLQNSATIRVSSKFIHIALEGVDEAQTFGSNAFN